MSMRAAIFSTILPLSLAATLLVRATTRYIVQPDRLSIKRIGFVWLEILFGKIEEIAAEVSSTACRKSDSTSSAFAGLSE